MKKREGETIKGIELLNQENIRTFKEKENYKYLGIKSINQSKIKSFMIIIRKDNHLKITSSYINKEYIDFVNYWRYFTDLNFYSC